MDEDPRFEEILGKEKCLTRTSLLRLAISYHEIKKHIGAKTEIEMVEHIRKVLLGAATLDDQNMASSETADAFTHGFLGRK